MKNTTDINNDGVNLYVTLNVQSAAVGKVVLLVLVLFLLSVSILLISTNGEEENPQLSFAGLLFLVLTIAFPMRYLLWNSFGKEIFIVTAKTISYCYDYGIIRTNLKTIHYDCLATDFEVMRKDKQKEFGKITFTNYRAEDHLPQFMHQTSVFIDIRDYEAIIKEMGSLFTNEYDEGKEFFGYFRTEC